jgi:hypothetical protein
VFDVSLSLCILLFVPSFPLYVMIILSCVFLLGMTQDIETFKSLSCLPKIFYFYLFLLSCVFLLGMTQGDETPYVSSMLTQKVLLFFFVFTLFVSFFWFYVYLGNDDISKQYETKSKEINITSKEHIDPKSIDPLCVWCFLDFISFIICYFKAISHSMMCSNSFKVVAYICVIFLQFS